MQQGQYNELSLHAAKLLLLHEKVFENFGIEIICINTSKVFKPLHHLVLLSISNLNKTSSLSNATRLKFCHLGKHKQSYIDLCLGSAIAQPALNQSDNCITSLQENCHRSVATGANMSFRMLLPGDNTGPESFESIFESSTNVNKTNFKVGEAG